LSADNVLSWEVITADGEHLTTNKDENADLFWALRGGGGGTFGVVMSITVKAHPGTITSGASLSFSIQTNAAERLWVGIQAFHNTLEDMVDAGTMVG
jgi:FAD/FMN-containing dehydrogenase